MHITGSHHWFLELFSQFHDLPIHLFEIFHGMNLVVLFISNHEFIVPQWLNLQVVIKVHQPRNLLGRRIP